MSTEMPSVKRNVLCQHQISYVLRRSFSELAISTIATRMGLFSTQAMDNSLLILTLLKIHMQSTDHNFSFGKTSEGLTLCWTLDIKGRDKKQGMILQFQIRDHESSCSALVENCVLNFASIIAESGVCSFWE